MLKKQVLNIGHTTKNTIQNRVGKQPTIIDKYSQSRIYQLTCNSWQFVYVGLGGGGGLGEYHVNFFSTRNCVKLRENWVKQNIFYFLLVLLDGTIMPLPGVIRKVTENLNQDGRRQVWTIVLLNAKPMLALRHIARASPVHLSPERGALQITPVFKLGNKTMSRRYTNQNTKNLRKILVLESVVNYAVNERLKSETCVF